MPLSKTRKVLIMRHAKSSWEDSGQSDFDRPLNSRGRRDAPKMGRYLKELELIPGQIISSPATRAKATILLVAGEVDIEPGQIKWDQDLYFGHAEAYLNAIKSADDSAEMIMTVGHNPMTEQTIEILSGRVVREKVSTASIACFEAGITSWKEIIPGECKLLWMVSPKQVKG